MKPPKNVTATEAVSHVGSGEKIVLGHAAVTPSPLVEALVQRREELSDVSLFHLIYLGEHFHLQEDYSRHFNTYIPFISGKIARDAVESGQAWYLPMHFSYIPSIFRTGGTYEPDWAFVQVTPPDKEGRYSLSLSCDYTLPAARAAKRVIAMVNPKLPYLGGDNFLRAEEIDFLVECELDPPTLPAGRDTEIDKKIASYCTALIPDGATLQIGIGAVPDAVLRQLTGHKDLGIHTEMFSDGVMTLHRLGVVTGKHKGMHPGKVASSFVMGTKDLYRYIDKNEDFELYPVDVMNNPANVGLNPDFISINSCVEVDLYGQVCSEKINGKMFSGSGGQLDYLRGVRYSQGGKSILTMPSTTKGGTISKIVPNLNPQATVTSPRNDVDYLVTEHGVARLFGKTEKQRALELCRISDPTFREELEREAYARFKIKQLY